MLADELRTLADDLSRRLTGKGCTMDDATLLANLRALAAKLEGKVVVRPHIISGGKSVFANLPTAATMGQYTEAEAVAHLQKLLDGEG